MTGPLGNSEFCFPRMTSSPGNTEILEKQNSLFSSGPALSFNYNRDLAKRAF